MKGRRGVIEFGKWIYSQDIAEWLLTQPPLSIEEQTDCILSAPHRHLEEKLDGLRELGRETGNPRFLEDKIEMGETLLEIIDMRGGLSNLYEADLFCHGRKEEFVKRRIFALPGPGIDFIRKQIREAADRYEIDARCFFGVLYKFYRRGYRHLELEWNMILNPEGKLLYCLPETPEDREENDFLIGPEDYSYMKLPYPTGTIVKAAYSPFFQPVKGIVVNRTEPWEEGFAEDDEQWLLYPDFLQSNRTGIGVIKLNDYASITFGSDYFLPFRQFLCRCEGEIEENEKWLETLAELIRKDKRCFGLLLKDQMPEKPSAGYEKCQDYVESLSERWERMR